MWTLKLKSQIFPTGENKYFEMLFLLCEDLKVFCEYYSLILHSQLSYEESKQHFEAAVSRPFPMSGHN